MISHIYIYHLSSNRIELKDIYKKKKNIKQY